MPDVTVSANVDTMLRAANNAAIRSAIGVGQTDAPTFLAQTLTGQSLTGTQATSLVDLAATWNTTGTPSALKLNVTNTASAAQSLLLDLQANGVSQFAVRKDGLVSAALRFNIAVAGMWETGMSVGSGLSYSWSSTSTYTSTPDLILARDAAGILAQRNGTAKQTLRIYNTYTSASIYERAVMDWNGPTPGNLQIGTEFLGSGSGMAARPIDFVTGGVVRMSIAAGGNVGIGTAAPNKPLTVAVNTSLGSQQIVSISNASAAGYSELGFDNDVPFSGGIGCFTFGYAGTGTATPNAAYFFNRRAAEISFGTTNTERMRITAAGNIGIGTTTPASKLQVAGGDVEVSTSTNGLILKSPDGTRYRVTVPNGGTVLTITAV